MCTTMQPVVRDTVSSLSRRGGYWHDYRQISIETPPRRDAMRSRKRENRMPTASAEGETLFLPAKESNPTLGLRAMATSNMSTHPFTGCSVLPLSAEFLTDPESENWAGLCCISQPHGSLRRICRAVRWLSSMHRRRCDCMDSIFCTSLDVRLGRPDHPLSRPEPSQAARTEAAEGHGDVFRRNCPHNRQFYIVYDCRTLVLL